MGVTRVNAKRPRNKISAFPRHMINYGEKLVTYDNVKRRMS